jgi:hypothetical protein
VGSRAVTALPTVMVVVVLNNGGTDRLLQNRGGHLGSIGGIPVAETGVVGTRSESKALADCGLEG